MRLRNRSLPELSSLIITALLVAGLLALVLNSAIAEEKKKGSWEVMHTTVGGTATFPTGTEIRVTCESEQGTTYDSTFNVSGKTESEAAEAIKNALEAADWDVTINNSRVEVTGYDNEFTTTCEPIKKVDGGDNKKCCWFWGDGNVEKKQAKPGDEKFHFVCSEPNADPIDPGILVLEINGIQIPAPLPPDATPTQAAMELEAAMTAHGYIVTRIDNEVTLDWEDPINEAMMGPAVYMQFGVDSTGAGGPHFELVLPDNAFMEIPFEWVEINPGMGGLPGINSGIVNDDQNVGPFHLGFNFPSYDGLFFNTIRVCSNGFATYTSTSTDFSNNPIPDPLEPNNLVAPYWDDMNPSLGGSIWYYPDPGGRFIIQWQDLPHYSTGGNYTFQAILYEDGTIDYMYLDLAPGTPLSATVGIENSAGDEGLELIFDEEPSLFEPEPGKGVRIFPVNPGGAPPWYNVFVELTYVSGSPVLPTGGNIYFDVFVENLEPLPVDFDAWLEISYMGGPPETVVMRSFTNYQPGWTINRPGMYYPVPESYEPGLYTMTGKVGNHPDFAWSESSFPFEKIGDSDGTDFVLFVPDGVPNPFDEIITGTPGEAGIPKAMVLHPAHPNPFNPKTVLCYELRTASRISLTLYDVAGRKVVDLVDGWRDAGLHEVTFDAVGLPSGVYFARLSAGDVEVTQKLLLLK